MTEQSEAGRRSPRRPTTETPRHANSDRSGIRVADGDSWVPSRRDGHPPYSAVAAAEFLARETGAPVHRDRVAEVLPRLTREKIRFGLVHLEERGMVRRDGMHVHVLDARLLARWAMAARDYRRWARVQRRRGGGL